MVSGCLDASERSLRFIRRCLVDEEVFGRQQRITELFRIIPKERSMPKKRKPGRKQPEVEPKPASPDEQASAGVRGLIDTEATDAELDAFVDQFNAMVDAVESQDSKSKRAHDRS